MDKYCIDIEVLLDSSSPKITTLENPAAHSYHCLLDVGVCVSSGFTILSEPANDGDLYSVDYQLDDEGNGLLLELGRSTGKKGYCNKCTAAEGPEYGFRAGIKAGVTDANKDPPEVKVFDYAATTKDDGYCANFAPTPLPPSAAPAMVPSMPSGADDDGGESCRGSMFFFNCKD